MTEYARPLLTEADLSELTGLDQAAAQIRWLTEQGIPYRIRRDGRPRTTWGAVDAALLGRPSGVPDLSRIA